MEILKECITCHRIKPDNRSKVLCYGSLSSEEKLKELSSDILGPFKITFKEGEDKCYYIVAFTCRLTRFTEIKFIRNIESTTIRNAFNKVWISKHGNPKTLLCDQGRQYTLLEIKNCPP